MILVSRTIIFEDAHQTLCVYVFDRRLGRFCFASTFLAIFPKANRPSDIRWRFGEVHVVWSLDSCVAIIASQRETIKFPINASFRINRSRGLLWGINSYLKKCSSEKRHYKSLRSSSADMFADFKIELRVPVFMSREWTGTEMEWGMLSL